MPTFAVRRIRGRAWNPDLEMASQILWREHAAFMNALALQGFVVLGGPLGGGDTFLLMVEAPSESAVESRLAEDPLERC